MRGVLAAGRASALPAFAHRDALGEGPAGDTVVLTSIPEEIGPGSTDLSQTLAPNVALLIVTKTTFEGMPTFQLYFHYRGRAEAATSNEQLARQHPDPSISLATLTARHMQSPQPRHWRQAYGKLRNWWTGVYPLSRWLGSLVDADDHPRLIVWDETDYEIPWELFYRDSRPPNQGRSGWLGELIQVIRWTTTASAPPWRYTAQDRQCDGELLIAEHLEAGQQSDPFADYPVVARFSGLREMLIRLGQDDLRTFSLAIVHVHGEYSAQAGEFMLDGVPLNELDEYPMNALARSGAVVLLNACASGRPSADPASHQAVPRSFVEVFLRSGAGGVIATAADIDLNHRHDFVVRLVESARDKDLNVAAALQSLRADHARKAKEIRELRDKADLERAQPSAGRTLSDEELERLDKQVENVYRWFFAWFAYLYFGHPGTALRVRKPGQP